MSAAPGEPAARRGSCTRRLAALAVLGPLAIGVACGGWAGFLRLSGNLHAVEPGVYRSAQPSAAALASLIRRDGIRTVLNLRGENPGRPWFEAERRAVAEAGATLVSIPLSANREPDPATLERLVAALETASLPLLIHCDAGADRSGLAAALYELLVAHRPADVARGQLSFAYGHFPWLLSRSGAMDRSFARLVPDAGASPDDSGPLKAK